MKSSLARQNIAPTKSLSVFALYVLRGINLIVQLVLELNLHSYCFDEIISSWQLVELAK